jgi:hypothetical protein
MAGRQNDRVPGDTEWMAYLDRWCGGEHLGRDVALPALRTHEDYALAYVQHKNGASDRIVHMLLHRAAIQRGLIEE